MKKRNHLIFLLKFSNFQIINFLQNTQFKSNVLFTGSILNVESATLKVSEGREKAAIDPDNTVCHENGGKMKRYTQIMRVFYVIGEPANETIGLVILSTFHIQLKNNFSCSNIFIHIFFPKPTGMKDFVPSITRPPDLATHAQFQTFDDVMMRFCKWLPHQTVSSGNANRNDIHV